MPHCQGAKKTGFKRTWLLYMESGFLSLLLSVPFAQQDTDLNNWTWAIASHWGWRRTVNAIGNTEAVEVITRDQRCTR